MAHTTKPSLCFRYGKKFTHVIPSNLTTTYEFSSSIFFFSSSIISISQMRKLRQREVKEVHKDSFLGRTGILNLHLFDSRILALTHYPELELHLCLEWYFRLHTVFEIPAYFTCTWICTANPHYLRKTEYRKGGVVNLKSTLRVETSEVLLRLILSYLWHLTVY